MASVTSTGGAMMATSAGETTPGASVSREVEGEIVEYSPKRVYGRTEKLAGKGSFKRVYEAWDFSAGHRVAWNVVALANFQGDQLARFSRELMLLKTLHHKRLIKLYSIWRDKESNKLIFITELMESGTLADFRSKYPLTRRRIREWCVDILDAVDYLHTPLPKTDEHPEKNEIIHRYVAHGMALARTSDWTSPHTRARAATYHSDLKCENIFVSTGKSVKVGDLGLATTDGRSVMGTPEFMAPELFEQDYTTSVDIHAFGMVLLQLVVGTPPYKECTSFAEVYTAVANRRPPAALRVLQVAWPEAYAFVCECTALSCDDEHAEAGSEEDKPHGSHIGTRQRPTAKQLKVHPFLDLSEPAEDDKVTTDDMVNRAIDAGVPRAEEVTISRRKMSTAAGGGEGVTPGDHLTSPHSSPGIDQRSLPRGAGTPGPYMSESNASAFPLSRESGFPSQQQQQQQPSGTAAPTDAAGTSAPAGTAQQGTDSPQAPATRLQYADASPAPEAADDHARLSPPLQHSDDEDVPAVVRQGRTTAATVHSTAAHPLDLTEASDAAAPGATGHVAASSGVTPARAPAMVSTGSTETPVPPALAPGGMQDSRYAKPKGHSLEPDSPMKRGLVSPDQPGLGGSGSWGAGPDKALLDAVSQLAREIAALRGDMAGITAVVQGLQHTVTQWGSMLPQIQGALAAQGTGVSSGMQAHAARPSTDTGKAEGLRGVRKQSETSDSKRSAGPRVTINTEPLVRTVTPVSKVQATFDIRQGSKGSAGASTPALPGARGMLAGVLHQSSHSNVSATPMLDSASTPASVLGTASAEHMLDLDTSFADPDETAVATVASIVQQWPALSACFPPELWEGAATASARQAGAPLAAGEPADTAPIGVPRSDLTASVPEPAGPPSIRVSVATALWTCKESIERALRNHQRRVQDLAAELQTMEATTLEDEQKELRRHQREKERIAERACELQQQRANTCSANSVMSESGQGAGSESGKPRSRKEAELELLRARREELLEERAAKEECVHQDNLEKLTREHARCRALLYERKRRLDEKCEQTLSGLQSDAANAVSKLLQGMDDQSIEDCMAESSAGSPGRANSGSSS